MITLYGYKKCGTCRKAEKALTDNGIDYKFIDITTTPPDKTELESMIKLTGKELKKFFNTSGVVYREMELKEKLKSMSDEEKLELLASNGKLIKRPLTTDGISATVGFNEDEFLTTWK